MDQQGTEQSIRHGVLRLRMDWNLTQNAVQGFFCSDLGL